jgi:hypothetical protein
MPSQVAIRNHLTPPSTLITVPRWDSHPSDRKSRLEQSLPDAQHAGAQQRTNTPPWPIPATRRCLPSTGTPASGQRRTRESQNTMSSHARRPTLGQFHCSHPTDASRGLQPTKSRIVMDCTTANPCESIPHVRFPGWKFQGAPSGSLLQPGETSSPGETERALPAGQGAADRPAQDLGPPSGRQIGGSI